MPESRKKTKTSFSKIEPYLYLAPATILIILVFVYPILENIHTSFLQNTTSGIKTLGLTNYKLISVDPIFWQSLENNGKLLFSVPIMTVLSLFIAIMLFEHVRGWMFYRFIIFMPYILAIPVVGQTFVYLLGLNGILNSLLRDVGLALLVQDWLGSAKWVIPSISMVAAK